LTISGLRDKKTDSEQPQWDRLGRAAVRPEPCPVLRFLPGVFRVSCSERRKEIRRRRHRRKKVDMFKKRLGNATVSEKQHIADKLRQLTPGAELVVQHWALEER
jgi:hypothetical protein